MAVSLEDWEERLERHFASLARTRADSGFPIFALEHGLSQEEFDHIAPALRPLLKHRRTLPCWLLWVVYATELGYGYAGDEYWSSFQEQTPEWEYQDRDRIKPWFRKFHQSYRGVVPSGQWAEHFRIIAWPITHAILPRYLQRQFARALYDLRFRLASLTALEPRKDRAPSCTERTLWLRSLSGVSSAGGINWPDCPGASWHEASRGPRADLSTHVATDHCRFGNGS